MNTTTLTLLVVVGSFGVLLAAIVLMYHKLSSGVERIRAELPKATGNVIRQLEALHALHAELGLKHPLPQTRGWAASPDLLRALMQHALTARPRCVVECSSGVSTIVLARCMQLTGDGHVHSLEHDTEFAEETRRALRAEALESFATVHHAPLREMDLPGWRGKWYSYDVLPKGLDIDLLVVDGPPWFVGDLPRYPAVPTLHAQLSHGAHIFLDDAAREEEIEIVRRWLATFSDLRSVKVLECEKGCAVLVRHG